MAGSDRQVVNTDSSQAPGLETRFKRSMTDRHCPAVSAAVTVQQFFSILHLLKNKI